MEIIINNFLNSYDDSDIREILPSDKSISQRALLIASLQEEPVIIKNLNYSNSILPLLEALKKLDVPFEKKNNEIIVGKLKKKETTEVPYLNLGSSSAAARFLIGVLVGLEISAVIDGDNTLRSRPMDWLIEPLIELGANIEYLEQEGKLPIKIVPSKIRSGSVKIKIGSAQAVSGVLFAAYAAKIDVDIERPVISRDHTERLLSYIGNSVTVHENKSLSFRYNKNNKYNEHTIPVDPSGIAYLIAAHVLQQRETNLYIKGVCLNLTRIGFIELLKKSGAKIEFENVKEYKGEPIGDIVVLPSNLQKPLYLDDSYLFHSMIDEVPLAISLSLFINGVSEFKNLDELIFKETDRIETTIKMLESYGASVKRNNNSIKVFGKQRLIAGSIPSFYDHRIAMSAVVVGTSLKDESRILESECINTSFPNFTLTMLKLGYKIEEE
nr:3-phosphoshikimate 1-carboxyvinyltransferase [uncultured Flavobacterium sp.]